MGFDKVRVTRTASAYGVTAGYDLAAAQPRHRRRPEVSLGDTTVGDSRRGNASRDLAASVRLGLCRHPEDPGVRQGRLCVEPHRSRWALARVRGRALSAAVVEYCGDPQHLHLG
jgi:hypothetical protein